MIFSNRLKISGKLVKHLIFKHQSEIGINRTLNSQDELFILFDFSCGRFYTHHSSYLKDYNDFLIANNKRTHIWVNTSADKEVLDVFPGNAKSILRSNLYSHTSKDNFKLFLVDYLVNLSERFNASRILKFFLN